jgi:uncharacterized protein YpmB
MTKKETAATPGGEPSSAPHLSAKLTRELEALHAEAKSTPDAPKPNEPEPETTTAETSAAQPEVEPTEEPTESAADPLENKQTDEAVDEIVKEESDEILADQDGSTQETTPKKRGFWGSIGHFFAAWWRNKWLRWITILLLLGGIGAVAAIPAARYYVLNKAGVRASTSLTVFDNGTRLPLKNVTVTVGGKKALTDSKGVAKVSNLKLGPQRLVIQRTAFATIKQNVTVGWGSNPLGNFILDSTGVRYAVIVTDFVSGKPISGAEVSFADTGATAVSDKQGKATITLDNASEASNVQLTVSASGYHATTVTMSTTATTPTPVALPPSVKTVFVAKENGRYNLTSMYLDGSERTTLLAGTGSENVNLSVLVDPAGQKVAYVSTRDGLTDADGYTLSGLALVDTSDGNYATISHAEHIQLVDWIGTTIIFEESSTNSSATDSNRYRLVAYDYASSKRYELAHANQFNSVQVIEGKVYYAVSSTDPSAQAYYFQINPDGTNRTAILEKEVWSAFRTAYDKVLLQTPDGWYSYSVGTTPVATTALPNAQNSTYVEGPDNQSLWINKSSGQGALTLHSNTHGTDSVLATQAGMAYPVRWLTDTTILYRVTTGSEVADYAVTTAGGQTRKVTDVVSTYNAAN